MSAVTGRDVADGSFDETVAAAVARALHQMAHVFPASGSRGWRAPRSAGRDEDRGRLPRSIGPPRIRPDVVWTAVESDVVAVDGAGRSHVIEGTGALLWPLLDGSAGADEIAADVADVFGIEADRARSDVETFLADAVKRGLVDHGAPTAPTDGRLAGSPPAPSAPPQPGPMAPPDPVWVGAVALDVGRHRVGLGADRADLVESLSELFGDWLSVEADDVPVEFGLSVDRRGGRGPRLIPSLLWGRSTLLKSRSLARLFRRLNTALGALVDEADASTVGLSGFAAIVRGDAAALVPVSLAERSTDVELAVAAAGAGIAEAAAIRLDLVQPGGRGRARPRGRERRCWSTTSWSRRAATSCARSSGPRVRSVTTSGRFERGGQDGRVGRAGRRGRPAQCPRTDRRVARSVRSPPGAPLGERPVGRARHAHVSDAGLPPLLRVGVLATGTTLARWRRAVLEQLIAGGDAELVLLVEEAATPTPRRRRFDRRFLWRLYNNVWVRRRATSIERVDCADILAPLARMEVAPVRVGRYAQHFPAGGDRGARGRADLDVLLRFGFGILGGEVLDVARHGVWSFHHDDERVIRGGPPSFWEVADGHATTGVLFQRLTERLDAGIPLGRATFRTVGHSYPRNRDRAAMGAAVLAAQAARAVRHGWLDPAEQPVARHRRAGPAGPDEPRRCSRSSPARPCASSRPRFVAILVGHRWTVGARAGRAGARARRDRSSGSRSATAGYLADPFPAVPRRSHGDPRGGVRRALGDGRDQRRPARRRRVDRPRRACSTPASTRRTRSSSSTTASCYCVPETARAGRVEAWRCVEFPDRWERHATLLEDVPLLDPTIVEWGDRWWLFGTRRDRDPLRRAVAVARRARRSGPWTAHRGQPGQDRRLLEPPGRHAVRHRRRALPPGPGLLPRLRRRRRGQPRRPARRDRVRRGGRRARRRGACRRTPPGPHTLAQRDGLVAVDARRRVVDLHRSRRELLARLRRSRA